MATFTPGLQPSFPESASAFWFMLDRGRLLLKTGDGGYRIPETADIEVNGFTPARRLYFGSHGRHFCYAAEVSSEAEVGDGFELMDLRKVFFTAMPEEFAWIAGLANQLIDWDRNHRYCGHCGHATEDKSDERAKICPRCDRISYPRLSPAVIVCVLKGDRILLARNRRFRRSFYSVLAGFVEPGETLEACIEREVMEEVGIRVRDIRYFGSQPWPFPDSLMVGFVAAYAGGDIRVDNAEITEAAWFSKDNLPETPPNISIAGQLIEWFVKGATP